MNALTRTFFQQSRIMSQMTPREYARYRLTRRGKLLKLNVHGFDVTVRKGTPDLGVALLSLGTELLPVSELLPREFDGVIIDGGGYIGTAALRLAQLYPQATVVTIEPSSRNLAVLERNVATTSNIKVIKGALGGESGATLTLRNRGTGEWGFTVVGRPADRPDAGEIETVPCFTIEDIAAMFPDKPIGVLKLDIEGGEKAVFDRSEAALAKIPVIFAELHERIAPGCRAGFDRICSGRWLVCTSGEKYLALKRDDIRH